MSPAIMGIIGIVGLFILMLLGMPIGLAMIVVGFLGYAAVSGLGDAVYQLSFVPFTQIANFNLTMLPLFMLMSAVAVESGITSDLYKTGHRWVGQIRGGLAMATILGCGFFSAIASDEVATASAMGKATFPEMKKYNYAPSLATGCIAAGGTLGVLIPPSVGFMLYGILTQQSIGRLFMAGILPGVLVVACYMATIYGLCLRNPELGPAGPKTTLREKIASLKGAWSMLALFLLVMGGIYMGFFTPTEAGAIGAAGAFVIGFSKRKLSRRGIITAFLDTGRTTGMVGILLIGAALFSCFLAVTKIPYTLADIIVGLEVNRYVIIIGILLFYIVIGFFLEVVSSIVLTLPIIFPLVVALGFDPIWYGVLMVRMMELGTITPPVAQIDLIIAGVTKVPVGTVFRGVVPFIVADMFIIIFLIAFPQISLWLPNMMR